MDRVSTDLGLRLLGGLSLVTGNGGQIALTRKHKLLIAALALAGSRGLSREKLIDLLWPDLGEKQARAALRQALAATRKDMGAYRHCLQSDGNAISIDAGLIEADVWEFERLASSENADDLLRATDLYLGDLLDGVRIKEDSFEIWLRPIRERLRAKAVALLGSNLEGDENPERCIHLASRLLQLEPANEAAHRALMRAYAAQSRTNMALEQFSRCREVLDRELAVGPSRETILLFEEIKGRRRRAVAERSQSDDREPQDELGSIPAQRKTGEGKPSIAVMPFENMTGDREQDHFVDGMVEDLLTTLAKVPDLFVIARASSFTYKSKAVDVRQVGRDLGIEFLVEGSVRKMANRVRVTAQLIECANGRHVWADRFDGDLDDIFELQDRLSLEIATALEVNLTEGEQARIWSENSRNPRAYEAFQKAMSLYRNFSRQTHRQARHILEEALQIDPQDTSILHLYCLTLADEARYGWVPDRAAAYEQALDSAARALAIDPDCGEAYMGISYIRNFQRRHDEAIEAAEKAMALRPNNTGVFHLSANAYIYAGDFETGLKLEEQARRLSPLDHEVALIDLARAHFHLDGFEEARQLAEQVLEGRPRWLTGQTILLAALWRLGRHDEARQVGSNIMQGHPKFSVNRWSASAPYRRPEDLEALMDPLRQAGLPESGGSLPATGNGKGGPIAKGKPKITVLPFENLSDDPTQNHFAAGMTHDIASALLRHRWLTVVNRTNMVRAGRYAMIDGEEVIETNVDYVVTGNIRRAADRIRVGVQMIAAESGEHIWSESYDRQLDDFFSIQDEITSTVAGHIDVEVNISERGRALRNSTQNPDAWDCYHRGMAHFIKGTSSDHKEAMKLFARCVELDPEFGEGHAWWSYTNVYSTFYFDAEPTPALFRHAMTAAKRAVEIDDQNAMFHMRVARVHLAQREYGAARKRTETSMMLNPNHAGIYCGLGDFLSCEGESEAAIPHFEKAVQLGPHDPKIWAYLGYGALAQIFAGDFEAAVDWADKAVAHPHCLFWAYAHRTAALAHSGRQAEARKAVVDLMHRQPKFSRGFAEKKLYFLKRPEQLNLYLDGLRKAGVPD